MRTVSAKVKILSPIETDEKLLQCFCIDYENYETNFNLTYRLYVRFSFGVRYCG